MSTTVGPIATLVYPGDPIPWKRARQGVRGQRFTDPRFGAWRDGLSWAMKAAREDPHVFHGDVAVQATFFRKNQRKSDLDNFLKGVMDAGNGVLWADDSQVVQATIAMFFEPKNPRTEVVVFDASGSR